MSDQIKARQSLSRRIKFAAASLISFIVTSACSLTQSRTTPTPTVLCYTQVGPTHTPTPVVLCYEVVEPTGTPTPFTSPLSPLPTPTPTFTPEARRLLLDRLLTEGRLPPDVVRQLEG